MKIAGKMEIYCGETKNEKRYICLVCDLGYRLVYLNFKAAEIAEMINMSPKEFYERTKAMKPGDYIEI